MRQIWKQFRPYINATTTTKVVRHFSSSVNVAKWKLDKSWYENSQKCEDIKLKVEALEDNLSNGSSVAIDQVNALLRECRENKCHYMVGRLYDIINNGTIHLDYTTMEELIYASIERKELKKAKSLFDKVEKKYGLLQASNLFDALIAGFFETEAYVEGWDMLNKMQCSHVPFTNKTYEIILRHCTQDDLQKCLNSMSQNCIIPTDEILEALIAAYVRLNRRGDALKVLTENDSKPNLKNSLITSYLDSNLFLWALTSYQEMKQDGLTPRVMTTTKILQNISYWSDEIYVKELFEDLESASQNYNEWAGGCTAICNFYIQHNMKGLLFTYMEKKLQYWPEIYVYEKSEIFNRIFRRIQQNRRLSSKFGLEVLQWSKNVLHFIPSRAAHDFLLYMAYQNGEWALLELLLAEYKTSGYEFSLQNYMFVFKARLTRRKFTGAKNILTEVAQVHNDGLFHDLYPGPTKHILNVFSKYYANSFMA